MTSDNDWQQLKDKLALWNEKCAFLEKERMIVSSSDMKFELDQRIKECYTKIYEIKNIINNLAFPTKSQNWFALWEKWEEKLYFFMKERMIVSSPDKKFELNQRIKECYTNINEIKEMINDVKFPPNINEVTFPPNWKNTYALPPENCKNQSELFRYLDFVIPNLRENHGFLDIKQNIANEDKKFNFVARKQSFDMSIRFAHCRGEAFFIFAEFYQLNIDSLREFSIQCLKYAQEKTELHTLLLQRFYDFRPPISICFSIALVDELDENTREKILTTNTLRDCL
ncbi:hypothetical protein [Crocosphaera sp.]|uniref:hypothetical protein n=1 Tax=Crocosphaera sp. TaxID=2729996 RepID=UPI002603CBE2|nr:hypothetical protein [Crocosphaera sp.]MDJ0582991.1 hypothetical protein [Crocosphaera sp.]